MSAKKDTASKSFTTDDLAFLAEFFTGRALSNLSISHKDAMEAIRGISKVVDYNVNDPRESLAAFISQLGAILSDEMESPIAHRYADRLRAAAHNGLHPTHLALQTVSAALEDAHKNTDNRDPEVRKKIAKSLKKVPAAIDYIVGQMESFAADFSAAQNNFRAELEHQQAIVPENMRAHDVENKNILEQLEEIQSIFNRSRMPVHNFRSQHIRIKNLATRLEKNFMLPPTATSEIAID
jgi:hypothetical protein